jgi:hypothetical protein
MSIQALMQRPGDQWNRADLLEALQDAVDVEFATIPPYLCALWSIMSPTGDGQAAAQIIRSVVREEMLHMGLVCNLLAGIGGTPQIIAPIYPGPLPGDVRPWLTVGLEGLSICGVRNVFMQIEYPEHGPVPIAMRAGRRYATIGEFYDALLAAFEQQAPRLDPDRQHVNPALGLQKLQTAGDVRCAICNVIKTQGEGTSQSPFATGMAGQELAHYYRFWQIAAERKILVEGGKAKWGPEGSLPFPAVYPMASVPRCGYPDAMTGAFDGRYRQMIIELQTAWALGDTPDGRQHLTNAITIMRQDLARLAVPLMQTEIAPGKGNYGPDFRCGRGPTSSFDGPVNSYSDVQKLFNDFVSANNIDLTFSPHAAFWNSLSYDQFVSQDVPGVPGVPILKRRDGNGSNIVKILKGPISGPNGAIEPMPPGGPYFSDAQIAALVSWIDRDCPP